MSTYLVAFIVSDFEKVSKNSSKNILTEILARKDAIARNETDFALEEAVILIDFFADYFNVSYPFNKLSKILFV
jgi:aminopeptidase N